ncbi:division/cell wall cluster transcriptional repressor MraZ [Flaviflexus equikiangi]|uniref:Transcriptional regulator MraZ n=1 Tax=Flaviflexus equikiangi TaxID=2758573 RepID=A0ABS2TFN2_9ACTO|nr:division/cell wall cluster transcriptional repressor MraZ [Flaviflexus equikiangi]MBM9433147.1 division/cell wall cluster transcriptional repressor MraZ [Flaviflexus equikiangi]
MFLGTYEPKLDEKGRLILPAKYRDQLAGGLVITRGQEHCLYVFPAEDFMQMQEEARRAPLSNKEARNYLRVFLSGAVDQEPDRQGRISIPANLRTYAGLERDLAVIGAGNRVEIWNLESWNDFLEEQEAAFADRDDEIIPGVL